MKSLSIESEEEYNKHILELKKVTEQVYESGLKTDNKEYHQYQHLVTRVHDQFGNEIPDYFVEFFQDESDPNDEIMIKLHSEILEKVKKYEEDSGYRSFLFDITDMKREILDKGFQIDMSIYAHPLSEDIRYSNPQKFLVVGAGNAQKTFLNANTTLLIDIELPRLQSEKVFSLRKH